MHIYILGRKNKEMGIRKGLRNFQTLVVEESSEGTSFWYHYDGEPVEEFI